MSLAGGGSGSGRGVGVVSDKPQPVPLSFPVAATGDAAAGRVKKLLRLKREDHTHVKHDDCFSEWKVLVGPSDWKEHASGKIPDRFRISNLPSNYVGSGLYELGVTPPVWRPPQRDHDALKPQDVVVVYLGCSDNVHQRLLRYGQTGAHLEGVRYLRFPRSLRLFIFFRFRLASHDIIGKVESFQCWNERFFKRGKSSGCFEISFSLNFQLKRNLHEFKQEDEPHGDELKTVPHCVEERGLGTWQVVSHHENLQRWKWLLSCRSTRLFAVKNDRADGWKADLHNGERLTSLTRDHERTLSIERAPSTAGSRPTSNASMDANDEAAAPSTSNQSKTSSSFGSLSPRGPRLFSEVFALGCSIAFRWAATDSKAEAERSEADLVEIFDYAWKRGGNFRQRSPDILAKIVMGGALGSNDSSYGCFGASSTWTWFFFHRARVGAPISARKPGAKEGHHRSSSSRPNRSRVGDFLPLFRTSPQCKTSRNEFTKLDIPLDRCSALLDNGFPCNALPVKGGKRCHLHKDQRKQSQGKSGRVAHTSQLSPGHDRSHPPDGAESPILPGPEPRSSSSCFPYLLSPAAPAPNRASPEPKRHSNLSFTSWLRTSEIRMARSREWDAPTAAVMSGSPEGATAKRSSARYSARYSGILATTLEEAQPESPFGTPPMSPSRRQICGLRLDDGTVCPDPPRPERKRCEAHKGRRNQSPKSPRASSIAINTSSTSRNGMPTGGFS